MYLDTKTLETLKQEGKGVYRLSECAVEFNLMP
jgi:hypothetical protein